MFVVLCVCVVLFLSVSSLLLFDFRLFVCLMMQRWIGGEVCATKMNVLTLALHPVNNVLANESAMILKIIGVSQASHSTNLLP